MTEDKEIQKSRKIYGYLSSLSIFASIIHLLGFILFQSYGGYDASLNTYSGTYGLSFGFSSSLFSMLLASKVDFALAKTMGAIVSVLLGLGIIFTSSKAVKGKFVYHYIGVGLYLVDTLFLIPDFILSLGRYTPLRMSLSYLIVNLVLHLVFFAVLIYSVFLTIRLQKYENDRPVYQSEERKSL